jgi:hypothetical protein
MEQKRISDEDFNKLTELKTKFFEVTVQLGQYQIDKMYYEDQIKQLNHLIATSESTYRGLIIEESKLSEDLRNKYGTVDIDIETGNISEKSIV